MASTNPAIHPLTTKHVLMDTDLTPDETRQVLDLGLAVKQRPDDFGSVLRGRYAAMLFEKPSLRTRVTFELGMKQLGGDAVFQDHKGDRIGEREPARDMARNLDRWFDVVIARTFSQDTLTDLAAWSRIPLVNALSGLCHPCQALADFLTLSERHGDLKGLTVSYVGDGNNVAHSILMTGAALGVNVNFASPKGYEPDAAIIAKSQALGESTGAKISILTDPFAAVEGASAIYTDVWTSMGWERETQERRIAFAKYQVNSKLMAMAAPDAVFMHCLPALRGEEVTDTVIESDQSVVFDQAENRLHAQKALLMMLLAE